MTAAPRTRPYLRAAARTLAAPALLSAVPGAPVLSRWTAAHAAALVLGRLDAGVLDREDVAAVGPLLRQVLGDDLDTLRGLWLEAMDLPDGDVTGLLAVGTRWAELLGEPETGPGGIPPAGCALDPAAGSPACAPGEDQQGAAAPGDAREGSGQDLATAAAAALQAAAEEASAELAAEAAAEEAAQAAADLGRATADQRARDIAAQRRAAQRLSKAGAGSGGHSPLGTPRPPTEQETALARRIGQVLRRAQFREPDAVAVRRALPPGRLDSRAAMQADAQRSMGIPVSARPFTATARRHVPEPPLTLGVLIDVSSSMRWATRIMATLAWAFSHAMTSVHGVTATVAFGSRVTIVTPPGTPPRRVTPFSANEGTERFTAGFDALDGLLNLTAGRGARILVVVSDGHLTGPDGNQAAVDATARMRRNGGMVLWLDDGEDTVIPDGAIPLPVDPRNTADIPAALTQALAAAIRVA